MPRRYSWNASAHVLVAIFCALIARPVDPVQVRRLSRPGIMVVNQITVEGEAMEFNLQVSGMSCQHCVAAVTRAVKAVDANAQVKIDLTRGSVTIDSDAVESQLRDAIDDAGYEVAGRSA